MVASRIFMRSTRGFPRSDAPFLYKMSNTKAFSGIQRTAPPFLEQDSRLLLFHLDVRSSETALIKSQSKQAGSWFSPVFQRSAQGVQNPKGVPLSSRQVASRPGVVHLSASLFKKPQTS